MPDISDADALKFPDGYEVPDPLDGCPQCGAGSEADHKRWTDMEAALLAMQRERDEARKALDWTQRTTTESANAKHKMWEEAIAMRDQNGELYRRAEAEAAMLREALTRAIEGLENLRHSLRAARRGGR